MAQTKQKKKKQPGIMPTLRPSSREELERKRSGVIATGPSGTVYRIRKINLERQAFGGSLPRELKQLALSVAAKSDGRNPAAVLAGQLDADKLAELMDEQKGYNDRLVLATVIEPALTEEDLGTGAIDDDPFLPAIDYVWLLRVAKGEEDRDAEDRMLWGPEPKSRMEIFRRAHECLEDCEACVTVVKEFTAYLAADVE
jgi:hypothetical protein